MISGFFAHYPTFQVFLGFVVAAGFTMVFMPGWIKFLKKTHIGQQVRADGPQSHLVKQGTPTMGGVIMLIAIVLTILLIAKPSFALISAMLATLAAGALGLFDDASKVVYERSLGLTPKGKLLGQFAIATIFTLAVVNWGGISPVVKIPFLPALNLGILTTTIPVSFIDGGFQIPWLYLIFANLLLGGMSNAVNLTDGLDGLASGTVMVVMLVMAAIAYHADMLAVSIFAATMAGACVGFLWFNAHPADIFMGDTGSLALGAALACIAMLTKTELYSVIVGGLFVAEALSVIIQVLHYKRTKKRLFLMAPLHHHFEKKGWGETRVVIRFWIVSGVLAGLGFMIYFVASAL
ncbi:MAG: phospho-N-acetylmuramoyl-pentapeptide-transferase [Eggerthellaceae bacterium]|nr:phospho-N-acetylmuramoyl-pentapeptide-transferase [Eggerthellaceae bacterium]